MSKPMISNIDKNQFRHQGYSLGVLIDFGNFNHSLDLVETHSNITTGSEERLVEVLARHSSSYEKADDLKYLQKINSDTKAIALVS